MEQYTQPAESYELPEEAYRLAEDHQVGFPLHLYNMRPRALSMFKWILVVSCAVTLSCVLISLIYLIIRITTFTIDANDPAFVFLPLNALSVFMSIIFFAILQDQYKRGLPASVLVCSEGLLLIRPRGVEVTRWNEVNSILRISSDWGRKRYMLSRVKRKALFFGEAFEDLDGLKDQVEQHIKKETVKE